MRELGIKLFYALENKERYSDKQSVQEKKNKEYHHKIRGRINFECATVCKDHKERKEQNAKMYREFYVDFKSIDLKDHIRYCDYKREENYHEIS